MEGEGAMGALLSPFHYRKKQLGLSKVSTILGFSKALPSASHTSAHVPGCISRHSLGH